MKQIQRKGQMEIADAPGVVLIVGLLFLTLATVALIGQKFGDAVDQDLVTGSVTNESGSVNLTGYLLAQASGKENFAATITLILNGSSGQTIPAANYTLRNSNMVFNATALQYHLANISYTYTYTIGTAASNITDDLNTEIGNNTGIAGIVLTISLIGIVLSILIGVFLGVTRKSNRV